MREIQLVLFLLAFTLNSFSQLPSYVPANGLVAYYPFNGNSTDESGNGHNGTVYNASLINDRYGNGNSAYSFYGVDDHIEVNTVGGAFNSQSYTISFWYRTTQLPNTGCINPPAIISRLDTTGSAYDNFCIFECSGVANLNYLGSGPPNGISCTSPINNGNWHHILFSVDSSDSLRCYVDGLLNNTTPYSGSISFQDFALMFGSSAHPYWTEFTGDLDDIAIYNRSLDIWEIEQLYACCQGANISNNVIAKFDFTGNANDTSGHGHNGVVWGATLTTDRFNHANSAYLFNGTTDYIIVPNSPSLCLSNTDFTISSWINESSISSAQEVIISKRTGAGQNGYMFHIEGAPQTVPGRVNFHISGGNDPKAYSNSIIGLNAWHHIAVVYSITTQAAFIYIDGILNTITQGMPSPNLTTSQLRIGTDSVVSQYFFHGAIDDIIIYDRALNNCDIDSLYHLPGCPVDISVTVSGSTLFANNDSATYQWVDCNNGFSIIQGETNQSYTPVASGSYAVILSQNSCVDTSTCNTILTTGTIVNAAKTNSISVFPNPSKGSFTIMSENKVEPIYLQIFDISDRSVYNSLINGTTNLSFEGILPAGFYLMRARQGIQTKTIKLLLY